MEVRTFEHLMSAVNALGIDNLEIKLNDAEVPILDGSASGFIKAFRKSGLVDLKVPKKMLRIVKPVEVRDNDKTARLEPSEARKFSFEIDFANPVIGKQSYSVDLDGAGEKFQEEISGARTFGFLNDAEDLLAKGFRQRSGGR